MDDQFHTEFTSTSEEETLNYGHRLAETLSPGDIVALQGALGSGKTRMVKGMARAFGVDEARVHSPTFALIHEYEGDPPLYHFDCYRMESVREALEIGAEEYFYGRGVTVIEWPERIAPILPEHTIWIELAATGPRTRQFNIKKKAR